MSKRKYAIRRGEGLHLTDRQREILGNAWNQYVNRLVPVSMREFARLHGVPYSTWQREFRRGAASPIMRRGNRWTYPEYDIDKARASINEGRGNMGAKMKLTVVSKSGTRGGLLVMLDRCSRRYVIEHLNHINQDEVVRAIRRMKARKALPTVRSVTTDNGCEFLSQERLDRAFRAETYYTRSYASYEKGAIENCNRLVRRWYPKRTDFNQLTRRQIRQLEDWINTIHRESLNGETAYAYDSRLAKAA